MNRIHSTFIALVICAAATVGLNAAVRTVRLGQTPAAPISAHDLAARHAKLDAWGHSLDAALTKRPPALPKLPHYAPVRAQPAQAPSTVTAPPPVTYVHAPTVVEYEHAPARTSTTSRSDDDSSDDTSEDDGSDDGGSAGGD
jgi:hypothetical protein